MPPGGGSPPIDLMIVGAPKAGTTSLKAYLGQHPAVATHDAREFIHFANDEAFRQGYDAAFAAHFAADARTAAARVAKSVAMMYSREALARLKAHNPEVQVVLVLREPVARAHSEFWYAKRRGREPAASFAEALDRIVAQPTDDARTHDAYLARGRYAEFLGPIVDLFGSARVSVLLLEELERDPVEACRALFARLAGVDAGFAPAADRRHNEAAVPRSPLLLEAVTRARRQPLLRGALRAVLGAPERKRLRAALFGINEARFEIPPLDAATRERLEAYFAPWNARLEAMLGRSLAAWQLVSRTSADKA
jgi:hypothetical protein